MNAKEFILCDINGETIKPIAYSSYDFKEAEMIRKLIHNTNLNNPIGFIAYLHDIVGISFAKSLMNFIKKVKEKEGIEIKEGVIGFHGQTIFHMENFESQSIIPSKIPKRKVISLQIGEPSFLSSLSGMPTVYDFRKTDIAFGGRGAPLSPIIHFILFRKIAKYVCVLNLGGIANITEIHGEDFSNVKGKDISPANALSDFIAQKRLKRKYDPGGKFASEGKIIPEAFEKIVSFLSKTRKTTLGYEVEVAKKIIFELTRKNKISDALRTAIEIPVYLISKEINRIKPDIVVACGGGTKNLFLIKRLKEEIKAEVITSSEVGIRPEFVEPMLFAYLAYLHINRKKIGMRRITGASKPYLPGKMCKP